MLVITGASGSGKTTLLKEFLVNEKYHTAEHIKYDNDKAIISNFKTPDIGLDCRRLD